MHLGGIHHVTAVTGNASRNVAFYTQVLGMRLVKKTVNQDDVSAYHLFFADELGSPGTDMTFFEWPHVGRHIPGSGEVAATAFGVRGESALSWWLERLSQFKVPHSDIHDRNGRAAITFVDPEGQRLELVDDGGRLHGKPWRDSPVPEQAAIRGLYAVTMVVESLPPTERVLTEVLSFRNVGEYPFPQDESRRVVVFETAGGGPGTEVHVEERPLLQRARVAIGGVHHVAFRTPTDEEHREWRERIATARLGVTPVIDRFYFRSIYFREPGAVLFEIATDGPGFAADEDPEHLGERLSLPPFLEPHRAAIEANLEPVQPLVLSAVGSERGRP